MFCREVAILHRGRVALVGRVKELTAGKGYRLVAVDVPELLHSELVATASSSAIDESGAQYMLPDREAVNDVIDRLRAAGCGIESVTPTVSTLEEVFVKTVGEAVAHA
jgi:ABC-type multidrug transport system ATPase subunit